MLRNRYPEDGTLTSYNTIRSKPKGSKGWRRHECWRHQNRSTSSKNNGLDGVITGPLQHLGREISKLHIYVIVDPGLTFAKQPLCSWPGFSWSFRFP